jgi:hypothetical protein
LSRDHLPEIVSQSSVFSNVSSMVVARSDETEFRVVLAAGGDESQAATTTKIITHPVKIILL